MRFLRNLRWLAGAAFLLTLVLPWPWALAPCLALALFAPMICAQLSRRAWESEDWKADPPFILPRRLKGICVEPSLLIGERRISGEIWLPFECVTAERFRSKSGALALSAAVALTDDLISHVEGIPLHDRTEVASWELAMSIQPGNFKSRNERIDVARYHGYNGVIVRDGGEERAYFLGGPSIAQCCVYILDGTERIMMREDRERLALNVPANALCYITAQVVNGHLDRICYLGAVRPTIRCLPDPEALNLVRQLERKGIATALRTDDRWALETVRSMDINLPEDDYQSSFVQLTALRDRRERQTTFVQAVDSLRRHCGLQQQFEWTAAIGGLLLWICSLLTLSQWPVLLALTSLCVSLVLCRKIDLLQRPFKTLVPLLAPLIPGVLIPMVMGLFLPQLSNASKVTAGAVMLLAEAGVFTLYPLLPARPQTIALELPELPRWISWLTDSYRVHRFLTTGRCLFALALAVWLLCLLLTLLIAPADPLAVGFGLIIGLLTGISAFLVQATLASPPARRR